MRTLESDQEIIDKILDRRKRDLTPFLKADFERRIDKIETEEKKTLAKYIQRQGNIYVVNWQALVRDHNNFRASEGIDCDFWDDSLEYLFLKGVLTHREDAGFHIFGSGMDICPRSSIAKYHFVRESDAKNFRRFQYANTEYNTRVINLGDLV